jgi:hypothetical protein
MEAQETLKVDFPRLLQYRARDKGQVPCIGEALLGFMKGVVRLGVVAYIWMTEHHV